MKKIQNTTLIIIPPFVIFSPCSYNLSWDKFRFLPFHSLAPIEGLTCELSGRISLEAIDWSA